MKPLKKIMQTALKPQQTRFRDKRGWYASSAFKCRRDLYWEATGEPVTNPPDMVGVIKMAIGKAVEEVMVAGWVANAHHYGLHLVGTQIQIGTSNPNIDGNLDALVYEMEDGERYVLEYKAKFFNGADMFMRDFNPSKEYLGQLGIYLKDLNKKSGVKRGCFIFVPISETHIGKKVQISCEYNPATDTITAYEALVSTGDKTIINYSLKVSEVEEWFKSVEKSLETKICPPPDYIYKLPLTREFLAEQSDYNLKAAIAGQKILGNWQTRYSRYFEKALKLDGTSREYTEDELRKLKNEFNSRLTPTGRQRKQIA